MASQSSILFTLGNCLGCQQSIADCIDPLRSPNFDVEMTADFDEWRDDVLDGEIDLGQGLTRAQLTTDGNRV